MVNILKIKILIQKKKIEDRHSDSEIFNRYSYNFTLALYDEDNNKFYYYEFDT